MMLSGMRAIAVSPTRVGMVRHSDRIIRGAQSFPHTRGDGPQTRKRKFLEYQFPPHAWGWSEEPSSVPTSMAVSPTRVGMVRNAYQLLP